MKKAIVFDFDGTLASSFPLIENGLVEACKKFRYKEFSKEEYARLYGPNELGVVRRIVHKDDAKDAFMDYLKIYERVHDDYIKDFIYPEFHTLFKKLKELNFKVYLLTGRCLETTMISLIKIKDKNGISSINYFDDIYTGSPSGPVKVNLLKKLMKQHKLNPDELVYIGDSKQDITQCNKANVDIISVTYNRLELYDSLNEMNPNRVAKDYNEFISLLEEMIKKELR